MTIDAATMRALITKGLPVRTRWVIDSMPLEIDFSIGHAGPRVLSAAEIHLDAAIDEWPEPWKNEWLSLLIFGCLDYAEGGGASPFLGIHPETGCVYDLDLERDSDDAVLMKINDSLEQFIACFDIVNPYGPSDKTMPNDDAARLWTIVSSEGARDYWAQFVL